MGFPINYIGFCSYQRPAADSSRAMPVGTEGIPNDHLQYAITWFSLALIWAAMTAFFMWRPGATKNG